MGSHTPTSPKCRWCGRHMLFVSSTQRLTGMWLCQVCDGPDHLPDEPAVPPCWLGRAQQHG